MRRTSRGPSLSVDDPALPYWQDDAIALGWPPADVKALASILALPGSPSRVVRVEARRIYYVENALFAINGVGKDGVSRVHEIRTDGFRVWNRYDPPMSTTRSADEPLPSSMITEKDPDLLVAVREMMPWPIEFREIEAIVRRTREKSLRPKAQDPSQDSEPSISATTPRGKKPEKRRPGSPLPGQMTLAERRR